MPAQNRDSGPKRMTSLHEILVRHALYPLWAVREHPGLYSYLKEYEETQFWSGDRIRELQWARLRRIVAFAAENCTFYKKRFRQAGVSAEDLREPKDLLRIPILTKDDIREHAAELTAAGLVPASFVDNFTGGSTGAPMKFKVSRRRWASRKAMTHRHDRWCGVQIGTRVGQLWGHPTERSALGARERLRQRLGEIEKAGGGELLAAGGLHLGCAVGKGQDHVTGFQANALLAVLLSGDVTQRKIFHAVTDLVKLRFTGAPEEHARVRGVGEIEFAGAAVEGAGDDRGHAEGAFRVFDVECEFVV